MPPETVNAALSYYISPIFSSFKNLIAAESTRHGGVSPAPFASLNLGINTADAASNVDENRHRFFEAIGAGRTASFASSQQVHGIEILHPTEPGRYDGYDALITNQPGLLIGVTVADCVPILIYDEAHQAVAAIHAGWKGTTGALVTKTLEAMHQQFDTSGAQCYAYIGTCIDECSFDVGPEVAELFSPVFKRAIPDTSKSYVDLKAANKKYLIDFGIPSEQIDVSPFSTVLHNYTYFSYRAEKGDTGRMLAVIGLKV